jgi:membrane fusion protein (multidrug efflux system)
VHLSIPRSLTVLALGAIMAPALAACGKHAGPPQMGPPSVGYVVVASQPVTLTSELPGRTSPFLTSDVRPQVNGIIKARSFVEGGDVKQGQALYQIDPAPYKAAYDQSTAQLLNAQANLATLKIKAERYADLVKINAVAKQDYDDANAAYKQAAATVAQNKASVEAARINLDYTKVSAPISGRIGRSMVTPGALVTSGQTTALATIQTLDPIYVDVSQSADQLLALKRAIAGGQLTGAGPQSAKVKLLLQDGTPYPVDGTLKFSEVTVDQTTGSVTLRAVFPNPNKMLLPGLYVRAVIVEGTQPNGVLAPQQAVSRNEKGQATAFVVDAQNKAEQRILKTGQAVGDAWLVIDGLKPGDKLITEGLLNVKPGAQVRPVPAGSPPAPPPGAPASH